MSPDVTHSIEISVTTEYLPEQSSPDAERYAFAYHITITNAGDLPARLNRRHWVITNGRGEIEEVRGDGVIGQQPVIGPGSHYRYTSGVVLSTPVGSMRGSYQMIASDGERFAALIPIFTLSVPGSLN